MVTRTARMLLVAAAGALLTIAPARWAHAHVAQPAKREAAPAGGVDLRPKFRVGEELKYVMTLENDGSTQVPPMEPSTQTSRQQVEFRLKTVSSDPDKGSVVELIYDSLRISIEAGEQKVNFDSTRKVPAGNKPNSKSSSRTKSQPNQQPSSSQPAPEADLLDSAMDPEQALVQALEPIVGSKLTLTIDPDGTITQVTGGSELASALVGQYAGPITDQQGVKDLFGPIFSVRKAKPSASVGEKWQNVDRLEFPMLGKLRLTTDYTLKSASRGKATVDFRGEMALDTETGLQDQAIKLNDTRYEGSYIWDTEAGALDSMQQVQKFTLDGQMQGATVKITSNGTVKIERQRR